MFPNFDQKLPFANLFNSPKKIRAVRRSLFMDCIVREVRYLWMT